METTPELQARVFDRLRTESRWWRRPDAGSWTDEEIPDDVAEEDLRFVLDRSACSRLVPALADRTHFESLACVTIELSRYEPLLGSQRPALLSVTAGAWAHWPSHEDLAPSMPQPDAPPAVWTPEEAAELLDRFLLPEAVGPILSKVTDGAPSFYAPRVEGKVSVPPVMYAAYPAGDVPDDADEWFTSWHGLGARIADPVLGVPRLTDERLAGSIQASTGTLTLFRLWEEEDRVLPNFLLLPAGGSDASIFERDVRTQVLFLGRLDAETVFHSWDATTDAEMALDRLADYEYIGAEAGRVVNPLLLALASSHDTDLERVHSAIDLVRTVLLQSGPEIIDLRRTLDRQRQRVDALRSTVRSYRRSLGERTPEGMTHVDEALLRTPVFDLIEHRDRQAQTRLHGVEPIRNLIDDTASVLADRREQTLARLGETAHGLNVVLFVLAVATAIDLLVHFNWSDTYSWVSPLLRGLLIVALVALVTWLLVRRRLASSSRSSAGLQASALRTRVVDLLQVASAANDGSVAVDDWPAFDRRVATELAAVWDAVDSSAPANALELAASGTPTVTLDAMIRRAEHWALWALLVGERPFPLNDRLPLLTCVLHFSKGGMYVSGFEFRQALVPTVAAADVEDFRQWGCSLAKTTSSCQALLATVISELYRDPAD